MSSQTKFCKKASQKSKLRGIVLSVEALLAAILLFEILLLAQALLNQITPPYSSQLEDYVQGLVEVGVHTGSWLGPLYEIANDTSAKNLIDSLPPALCAQAELYENATNLSSLRWSYVRSGCSIGPDSKIEQRWAPLVFRANSTNSTLYWARVLVYPRR
jgi:hypothetical protein